MNHKQSNPDDKPVDYQSLNKKLVRMGGMRPSTRSRFKETPS